MGGAHGSTTEMTAGWLTGSDGELNAWAHGGQIPGPQSRPCSCGCDRDSGLAIPTAGLQAKPHVTLACPAVATLVYLLVAEGIGSTMSVHRAQGRSWIDP